MEHYRLFSKLFLYPDVNYKSEAVQIIEHFNKKFPGYSVVLASVQKNIEAKTIVELQEEYISTFDINAIACLDIGYKLFGEDLKRGEFLLKLKEEYSNAGVDCGTELPDFLPNLLKLLSAVHDEEFNRELVHYILMPVVRMQIKDFHEQNSMYKALFTLLLEILTNDFGIVDDTEFSFNEYSKCSVPQGGCMMSKF